MGRTIVHLSDLHFGRVDPAIPPALLLAVIELKPDLVVVSGDLTQRARIEEFKSAAAFLAKLPARALVVPGNHDVPLYNIVLRGLWPLERFQRYITSDLTPFFEDSEIAVLGVNTARALTFKNGRINQRQIAAAIQRFALCRTDLTRIVVTHHSFETPEAPLGVVTTHELVGRATTAMAGFMQAGVDMILSGHLHLSSVGESAKRYPTSGPAMLLIQAGTATSTRRRGEVNAFNVLRITRPEVVVECRTWRPEEGGFVTASTERFIRTAAGWSRSSPS